MPQAFALPRWGVHTEIQLSEKCAAGSKPIHADKSQRGVDLVRNT